MPSLVRATFAFSGPSRLNFASVKSPSDLHLLYTQCRKQSPPPRRPAMALKPMLKVPLAMTFLGEPFPRPQAQKLLTKPRVEKIQTNLSGRHSRQHRDRRASQDHRQRWQHAALHHIRHARDWEDDFPSSASHGSYWEKHTKRRVLELNASDERGISGTIKPT